MTPPTPTNPQPREVLQCDRDRAYALWQSEGTGPYMPEVWAQAFAAHRQAAEASTHIDPAFVLPCDVKLPPAATIKAGCDLKTLMTALSLEGRPIEFPERLPAEASAQLEKLEECIRKALADFWQNDCPKMKSWLHWDQHEKLVQHLVKTISGTNKD